MEGDAPLVFEAVNWATEVLGAGGIDDARIDAEILLRFAMGYDRARFYARLREKLDPSVWDGYRTLVLRRAKCEPIAYITGRKEFMSLDFEVGRDVLIPRPETEVLAEFAVQFTSGMARADPGAPPIVLDIGTGCGCLAITIAKHVPYPTVYASDISETALMVAARNAKRHGVAARIRFRCGDVYEAFRDDDLRAKVNLMVSNPPYVSRAELNYLPADVREFEPEIAYFGGDDGLMFYRKLITGGWNFLADAGMICFEVGYGRAQMVRDIIASDGRYTVETTLPDPAGIERVVVARANT